MNSRRRMSRWQRLAAVGTSIGIGIALGLIVPLSAVATVGRDAHLPPPGLGRDDARKQVPFEIREPSYLPPGMSLFLVNYGEPEPDETAYSVGLYYKADDGRAFHIWQTDNAELAESGKDVMASGSPVVIRGRPWKSLWLLDQQLHVLNRFFPRDGVTLSLDGNIEVDDLRRVAASIPPD